MAARSRPPMAPAIAPANTTLREPRTVKPAEAAVASANACIARRPPTPRQRGYMAPRLRHDIDQERAGDFRQAYEDGGIVAIVLSEEEGMWIQLHQDITLADPCQLKHENGVIVAESCEKPTIQEEGRHAIRPALRNVGESEQQPARFNDAHAPRDFTPVHRTNPL